MIVNMVKHCVKAFRVGGYAMNDPHYAFGRTKKAAMRNFSVKGIPAYEFHLVKNPSLSRRDKEEIERMGGLC